MNYSQPVSLSLSVTISVPLFTLHPVPSCLVQQMSIFPLLYSLLKPHPPQRPTQNLASASPLTSRAETDHHHHI